VTIVTFYSCVIAGLLAWRDGHFAFLPWLIVTLGLFTSLSLMVSSLSTFLSSEEDILTLVKEDITTLR